MKGNSTTLQAELDALFVRASLCLVSSPAGGVWSLLPALPFHCISADAAWRVLHGTSTKTQTQTQTQTQTKAKTQTQTKTQTKTKQNKNKTK